MDDFSSRPATAVDELFDVLARTDRRAVVQYLRDRSVKEASIDDLADTLVAADHWNGTKSDAEIELHHWTLPKLADADIIDYDAGNETVRYRGRSDVEALIDTIGAWQAVRDQRECPMSIVVAELTVSSGTFVLGQVLHDHNDVRIDLTQFVPLDDALVPYFWAETEDVSAFEDSVRSNDRVASLTKLGGGHGRHLYRIEWATKIDGFISSLTEHDLIVEAATGNSDHWEFRVRGPDRGNLSAFQQTLIDHDIPIQVEQILPC